MTFQELSEIRERLIIERQRADYKSELWIKCSEALDNTEELMAMEMPKDHDGNHQQEALKQSVTKLIAELFKKQAN